MAREMKLIVFAAGLSLIGCVANDSSQVTGISSISEAVLIAAARASEHAELGGEKDAFMVETIGRALADEEDQKIVNAFKSVDARSVAALRVFFKPSDFEAKGRLLGETPKPKSLTYLNDLPLPSRWPIEIATSTAWGVENLRLDWKAKPLQNPSEP